SCALLFSTCVPWVRDAHHYVQLHDASGVADSGAIFWDRVQFTAVPAPPKERRKVSRARLTRPIGGRVGNARVFLVDVSVEGLRVAHQSALPAVGQTCRVAFDWQGQLIELDCEVIHNSLYKL